MESKEFKNRGGRIDRARSEETVHALTMGGGEGGRRGERKESNPFGKTEAVDLAAPLM